MKFLSIVFIIDFTHRNKRLIELLIQFMILIQYIGNTA